MQSAGLQGKKILVAGLGGKTGVSAARLLSRLGCSLILADNKSAEALAPILRELEGIAFTLQAGGMPAALAGAADLVLLSPGVPRSIPLVHEARALGKEVLGDVELASRLMGTPFAGSRVQTASRPPPRWWGAFLPRASVVWWQETSASRCLVLSMLSLRIKLSVWNFPVSSWRAVPPSARGRQCSSTSARIIWIAIRTWQSIWTRSSTFSAI